jgi:hypothetical protein
MSTVESVPKFGGIDESTLSHMFSNMAMPEGGGAFPAQWAAAKEAEGGAPRAAPSGTAPLEGGGVPAAWRGAPPPHLYGGAPPPPPPHHYGPPHHGHHHHYGGPAHYGGPGGYPPAHGPYGGGGGGYPQPQDGEGGAPRHHRHHGHGGGGSGGGGGGGGGGGAAAGAPAGAAPYDDASAYESVAAAAAAAAAAAGYPAPAPYGGPGGYPGYAAHYPAYPPPPGGGYPGYGEHAYRGGYYGGGGGGGYGPPGGHRGSYEGGGHRGGYEGGYGGGGGGGGGGGYHSTRTVLNLPIDLAKIESGADTRSTIMVRHIPSRYTQQQLIADLVETGFHGACDYVYLPVDFRNGCRCVRARGRRAHLSPPPRFNPPPPPSPPQHGLRVYQLHGPAEHHQVPPRVGGAPLAAALLAQKVRARLRPHPGQGGADGALQKLAHAALRAAPVPAHDFCVAGGGGGGGRRKRARGQ